ncbi:uncharacterized protein V6R79_011060 [Siganus canaliculatus]
MSNVQLSTSALERLVARRTFPLHRRTGVCRNLFGPVDHDELSRDMKDKLREISERDQQRWNFNFEANTPLVGDYEWEEVPVDKTPAFYQDSAQSDRTRVPATPVKQIPSQDSVLPETPHMDVLERLALPESSSTPSRLEVNQENRTDKLNSGTPAHKQTPCMRRKRTATTDNNTHITVSTACGTDSTKEDPLKVFLHYFPACVLGIIGEDATPCLLNEGRQKNNGRCGRSPYRIGCFGTVRTGGAQPEHRTRLSGLNGLGGKGVEREKNSPNDFYPVQM